MSTALAFDTLQYAKRLKQAGFTEEQAEIQAEALSELIDDRLATKLDLKELERQMRLEIGEVKVEIKELERAMKLDTKGIEERLSNKINEISYKITIKLGGMMVAGVVTLGAFLAFIKFVA
jgi:long-subunit acyl-CoA synthetase (AMP-forming)